MKKLLVYFKGVKKEMSYVRWPNRKNMVAYSIATISLMLFFALFFYVIDIVVAFIKTLG